MIALTVSAPSSTLSKSISMVRTAGALCVSRTQILVAIPNIPSLPTNAPRRSNPGTSDSVPPNCTSEPSLSTTSSPRTCDAVTPSLRQCGPPELLATLPPTLQLCWLLGSGAKCNPRCATWRERSRFKTPGSTHAKRLIGSTDSTRFIFVSTMTKA